MKSKLTVVGAMICICAFAGCAHRLSHGTVAMKSGDYLAHVSIHDVEPGQGVTLFTNVCEPSVGEKGGGKSCKREKIADGKVTRVFNEHYSEIEFPSGTKFREGDFVETVR